MDNINCNVRHTCCNRRCENSVHTTLNGTRERRRVVQLLPETWRWFPNCDHLTVSFGICDVGMTLDARKYQSLFTLSGRDCEIPNAIYHNHPLINAPMTIKHSLQCRTSLYYVPDSPAVTSYSAHDFTSCQSISPTYCLLICYVNCTVIVCRLTQFHYNI